MRDRDPKSKVHTNAFPRIFADLGNYVPFVEQPVVSLSLYNGAIQWLMEARWEELVNSTRSHLKMEVRKRWLPIHIFMDLLSNYTFYTNLTLLSIGVFAYRRFDKHDNVQFMRNWEKYAASFDAGLTANAIETRNNLPSKF